MATHAKIPVKGEKNGLVRIPSKTNPKGAHTLTYDKIMFVAYFTGEAKGNQTRAAEMCGLAHPKVMGSKYMADPAVRAAIGRKIDKAGVSSQELIARDLEIANFSPGDYMKRRANGFLEVDTGKLHRDGKMHMIKEIRHTRWGQEIVFFDSVESRRNLQRIMGLYNDKSTVVHQLDLTQFERYPEYHEWGREFVSGKIDADEFYARVQSLRGRQDDPPRVIEGTGLVIEDHSEGRDSS